MANVSSSNGLGKRPKLRFPGFDEPWNETALEELGNFYNGLSGKDKSDFGKGADYYITYMNVYKNVIADVNGCDVVSIKEGEHQNRVNFGDLLFTQSSETLEEVGLTSVWLNNGTPLLNSFCFGFHFDATSLINPRFAAYSMRTPYARKRITREGQGATRYNLSSNRLKKVKILYPSHSEQDKIAGLLSLLEARIEKQCEIIDQLKKYKRGAVRHLLSPKSCPLKNARWTTAKMGELGSFVKGAPLSKADISEEGTPFILYGELYTTYNEVVTSVKRRTQAQVDELFLSRVGDVVIPISGETSAEISTASCVMLSGVILARDLNIFRSDKVDGRIMSYLLNHVVNAKIARIAQGKSVVHIQASELGKLTLSYPDENTQKKLIGFLSKLDDKIVIEENALTFLTDLKEGLMQQLFI